ncbi:MAG: hypothetical protein K2H41_12620 [Acetatifactor sp.]|nr:hypothetical protein [Acetatifactor sp.]
MEPTVLAEGGSQIDTIITAAGSVVDFSGTLLTTMIAHPVYAFLFAAGFVGIGLGIVSRLKRTARR